MLYLTYFMMFLHTFVGLILIAVILLQRGRGGGLAGAFGGMGGQSAFGTKAGDLFTKITIVLATVWIVVGGLCVLMASNSRTFRADVTDGPEIKTAAEETLDKVETKTPQKPDVKGGKPDSDTLPVEKDDVLPAPAKPPVTDEKSELKPEKSGGEKDGVKKDGVKKDGDGAKETAEKPTPSAEKPAEPVKKPGEEAPKESTEKKPD